MEPTPPENPQTPPQNQPENKELPTANHPQPVRNSSNSEDDEEKERQPKAVDKFRAKLMQVAELTKMSSAQKQVIEKGLTHLFPNDLPLPNHPPYREMIHRAVEDLKQEGGSPEKAISSRITEKYNDLPWAHSSLLSHHLRKLCETGDLVVTSDDHYLLNHGNLTVSCRPRCGLAPVDLPGDSSSSNSIRCSSSTSSYSPTPKKRQQKKMRKRMYRKKRSRSRKKLKAEAESHDTEEEESEDTEEKEFESDDTDEEGFVITEEEKDVIEDTDRKQTRSSTDQSMSLKKYEGAEQFQSEKEEMELTGEQSQVVEYQKRERKPGRGRGRTCTKAQSKEAHNKVIKVQNQVTDDLKELKQGKGRGGSSSRPRGGSIGRPRGRPHKQKVIKEELQPSGLVGVFDVQNQLEKENEVIIIEPLAQGEVFEDKNGQKQQEIRVNKKQTQPEVQNDVMKRKNKSQDQKYEGTLEQNKYDQYHLVIAELGQQQEQMEAKEEFIDDVVMVRSEAQIKVGGIKELNDIQMQLKGTYADQNSLEQQNDLIGEMYSSQGEHVEAIKGHSQLGQGPCGEIVEKDQRPAQKTEVAGVQGQYVKQETGLINRGIQLKEVRNMVERMLLKPCDDGEDILGKTFPILPCKYPGLVTGEKIQGSLSEERRKQKSLLEADELFETSDWTQHTEGSPELKRMEKLYWIADQLPQQGTENELSTCQIFSQTPRVETNTDMVMKTMVSSEILHEQMPERIAKERVPRVELVTAIAESSSMAKYQHRDGPDGTQQSKILEVERLPETAISAEFLL